MTRIVLVLMFSIGGCHARGIPGNKVQSRAEFGEVWQGGQAGVAGPLIAIAGLLRTSNSPCAWRSIEARPCLGGQTSAFSKLARPWISPVSHRSVHRHGQVGVHLLMVAAAHSNSTKDELLQQLSAFKGGVAGAIAPVQPIPKFHWPTVMNFVANSLLLSAAAVLAKLLLGIEWLGPNFSMTLSAAAHGAYLSTTFLIFAVLDRFIPAFADLNKVARTIALYAMGSRLVPLRAAVAAILLAGASAVGEELLFRGCMQVFLANLLVLFLPTQVATQLAVAMQALIFGRLHNYTRGSIYFLAASIAGLAFGEVFALTGNIFVPIVMHFLNNFIGFMTAHVKVSRLTKDEQRALILDTSPMASFLRRAFYGEAQ